MNLSCLSLSVFVCMWMFVRSVPFNLWPSENFTICCAAKTRARSVNQLLFTPNIIFFSVIYSFPLLSFSSCIHKLRINRLQKPWNVVFKKCHGFQKQEHGWKIYEVLDAIKRADVQFSFLFHLWPTRRQNLCVSTGWAQTAPGSMWVCVCVCRRVPQGELLQL